jgi:hypothetical protein
MASGGKKKTTMAKLDRERKMREKRMDKAARKDARKLAAEQSAAAPFDDSVLDVGDETERLEAVVGVVEGRGVVARGLAGGPLLRPVRLDALRHPRKLEFQLAPVLEDHLVRLGLQRLARNRAHVARLLLTPMRA